MMANLINGKPRILSSLIEVIAQGVAFNRKNSPPVPGRPLKAGRLVGHSRFILTLCKDIGRVAATNVPVLIEGAAGTGKELVARALHQHGCSPEGPFVTLNFAAMRKKSWLERELSRYEARLSSEEHKGGRRGSEKALGGTLFLDEVSELSPGMQAKLLRLLQNNAFEPFPSNRPLAVNWRIVASTSRSLEDDMHRGLFREDLFHRLNGFTIRLLPLKQHPEDIPQLVVHFLEPFAPQLGLESPPIEPKAVEYLQAQTWPGNIRELEKVVRKALSLAGSVPIKHSHVQAALYQPRCSPGQVRLS